MTHLAPAIDYWFMFPACVVIAAVVISAGISGATMLLPLFFVIFPELGVPALNMPQAVGASLVLQISAFGLAVVRYSTRGVVVWSAVTRVAVVSVPTAVVGAIAGPLLPVEAFRILFAVGLVVVVPSLWRRRPPIPAAGWQAGALTPADVAIAGGVGGLFTGVVSAGVGEATVPLLSRRAMLMPLAAATATVLVAMTVGAATLATAARLVLAGSLGDQAWPVVAFGAPGAIIGEEIAVRTQGRIPDRPLRLLVGGLFLVISAGFVLLATH